MSNLLEAMKRDLDILSNSERKVAESVLTDPEAIINASMASVALAAGVSEPTVLRFCRTLGCEGFQEFKVRLAQSLVTGLPYMHLEVRAGDTAKDYATKVVNSTMDGIIKLRQQLDSRALDDAVQALARARKVEFYGLGASGAVAADAQHKFFRLGMPCIAYADSHMQCMSAATLGFEDVVVAISHTGRTKELLESVKSARESGATVIGITAPRSPLAEECSIVLGVDIAEDTDIYTPMISRIAHLLMIDILAVGVALASGVATSERLKRMKDSLRIKRVPSYDPSL